MTLDIILLAAMLFLLWNHFTTKVEAFNYDPYFAEYVNDIRFIESYVGPYIGEVYSYLRAKYSGVFEKAPLPPRYVPLVNDPALADPHLMTVRTQVKAWIESAKIKQVQKFGDKYNEYFAREHLTYKENANGTLDVIRKKSNGETVVYVV